jgi:hypothetical protein
VFTQSWWDAIARRAAGATVVAAHHERLMNAPFCIAVLNFCSIRQHLQTRSAAVGEVEVRVKCGVC